MPDRVFVETTIVSNLTARPSRDVVIAGHQQVTHEWYEAGLAFRIADRGQGERVEWLDGAVAAESSSGQADRSEAAEWLRLAFGEGPLPVNELFQLGRANGYTARMLR